jgi:soluble lytic murein transglycosylase
MAKARVPKALSCILATCLIFESPAFAVSGISVINISLDQKVTSPRWMYDKQAKIRGGELVAEMVAAKRALIAKNRGGCLSALAKAYSQGKSLGPWIAWNQLVCAQFRDKGATLPLEALKAALARVDASPRWLLSGPWVANLKSAYVSGTLALLEQQIKRDRRAAWTTVNRLEEISNWLTAEERANVYRWAGELAFIEQNLQAAQAFLQRSLLEKNNPDLRDKVNSIRTTLLGTKAPPAPAPAPVVAPAAPGSAIPVTRIQSDDLGISDQEREIFQRMNRSYESQDYVASIEDGIELIQKFPGSRRTADAADRILDIYLSLSNKTDEKFRHVRETVVREMSKADAGRMARWANNAYARGHYMDALSLAEKSYERYAGHPDSTKMLLLAGKAALASGEYDEAISHFIDLTKKHGGTNESVEANFRLGLIQFRFKRYAQAAAYFERLLALGNAKDFEYRALYWQWRSQQKIDKDKSPDFAKVLIVKYPLSYYGLRAQAELNGNALELKNTPVNVKVELRVLETERLAWERLNILLKAGWFKEAEKELEVLPDPQNSEERLVRAKFWAAAMRYDLAVQNVNKAMDDNPNYQQIAVLKIVFPDEFKSFIAKESKNVGVSEDWIRSLIRQESTFRPDVKSPSNAIGVMQLVPPTAEELARDLKIKNFQAYEGLVDPEINIKLGSTYLSRLIRSFNGNVPLALAAYNAGPTRLRRWLGARKGINPSEQAASSAPEAEVWIDEMPWEETSFYVKAILRNWLIYRLLNGSKVALTDPIWVDANPNPR